MTDTQTDAVSSLSDLFVELRAQIAQLPDRDFRKRVKEISHEILQMESEDERTRLMCLIVGQTGESPYKMRVKTTVWYT